jgi:SAM-dependent methyltransferase
MTQTSPAPSTYSAEQFGENYPNGVQNHYWNIARNRLIRDRLKEAAAEGPMLEIGCGRGVVVEYLRQEGLDCRGCELSASATPISDAVAPYLHLGVDAFKLSPALRHDVRTILLLDVLEHLDEPRRFLAQCFIAYRHCRTVLVTVPARQELWSNYDEHYGHRRRYDLKGLADLFDKFGFSYIDLEYTFHALYPPARLLRLLGLDRSTAISAPATPLAVKANRLLAGALRLSDKAIPPRVPGSSLLGVVRR